MIKLWWHRLTTERVNFGVFTYSDAEEMLARGWEIAKEEDTTHGYGTVYLEQRA